VETQSTNYPALSFYRKHGFRVAGFNDRLYTDDDLEDGEVALFLFWQRTR
jgi:ribosomal protein S18 acetylase RimI-like enzyme